MFVNKCAMNFVKLLKFEFIGRPDERVGVSSVLCRDFKLHTNSLLEQNTAPFISVMNSFLPFFFFFYYVSNLMNMFRYNLPP